MRSWPATLVAVCSLGAAIGANATVFGTLYDVYARRLPLPNAGELTAIEAVRDGRVASLSYSQALRLGQLAQNERLALYRSEPAVIARDMRSEESAWIDAVSGGYFSTLGATPRIGRVLTPDDASGGLPVAVISDQIWRRQFGADSNVVGRHILINRQPFVVVGVMPHSFGGMFFAHPFTLAIPITASGAIGVPDFRDRSVSIVARVRRDSEGHIAAARLERAFIECCRVEESRAPRGAATMAAQRSGLEDPPLTRVGTRVDSMSQPHLAFVDASRGLAWGNNLRSQYSRVMVIVGLGAALLLISACANVATIFATQSAKRRRELATRIAIGAGPARLVRQVFMQGIEVSVAAVAVGLVLGFAGMGVLARNLPNSARPLVEVLGWRPNAAFLGYSVAVSVVCTLVCAAWPARLASSHDILTSLRSDDRSTWSASRMAPVRALVALQIGLGLVLVTAALLFTVSLRSLGAPSGGYGTRDLVLAQFSLDAAGSGGATAASTSFRSDLRMLESISREGAVDRALAGAAPLLQNARTLLPVTVSGVGGDPAFVDFNAVSSTFFAVSGIGIEQGRAFRSDDNALSERVAMVSHAFARRQFGTSSPVGRSLMLMASSRQAVRIVGVARDAQYGDIHDAPTEIVYLPLSQADQPAIVGQLQGGMVLLAGRGAPASPRAVQEAFGAAASRITIGRVVGVRTLLDQALARERLANFLTTIFGAIAAVLVGLGTYGVIAFSVVQRTHEIGIRAALGATPDGIRRLFLRQTAVMLAAGFAVGIPGAVLAVRAISSMIYGTHHVPVLVILASSGVLAALAVMATLLPVARATQVSPTVALRAD